MDNVVLMEITTGIALAMAMIASGAFKVMLRRGR